MKVSFTSFSLPKSGTVALLVSDGGKLSEAARQVDEATAGAVSNAIKVAGFKAEAEKTMEVIPPSGSKIDRVVLVGVGKASELTATRLEYAGGALAGALQSTGAGTASVCAQLASPGKMDAASIAARVASGMRLRVYKFDKYKSKKANGAKPLASVKVLCEQAAAARKQYAELDAIAAGVHIARDLVNEPANILGPVEFAKKAEELGKLGVEVEVLGEKEMKKLKMAALLGVSQGSVRPPRLAVMRWNGGKKGDAPVALVGKGVVFDTGGISIKPAAGMEDMKGDMGGAAAVVGADACHRRPQGQGQRDRCHRAWSKTCPTATRSAPATSSPPCPAQTIEVLNTDAEGRLVLADALWYTQQKYKPAIMIDLATLTGAVLVALGNQNAGLFSNNDDLADKLLASARASGEPLWRLPLSPDYDKIIDTPNADMKNTGGRWAGSITAAQFLQRFANDVPWAHLDIAGTAMDSPKSPINRSWASGWGVRLLDQLVRDNYES
jgi:leucyl aminopeptidase